MCIRDRGSPCSSGVGNKPKSNYRLVESGQASPASKSYQGGSALKYINGSNGVSTKYQHIIIEAYASESGLKVTRNEAEIESVPSKPVLTAYTRRVVPNPSEYDHILLYSLHSLPTEAPSLRRLLADCKDNGVTVHFVLEDLVFPDSASIADVLERLS